MRRLSPSSAARSPSSFATCNSIPTRGSSGSSERHNLPSANGPTTLPLQESTLIGAGKTRCSVFPDTNGKGNQWSAGTACATQGPPTKPRNIRAPIHDAPIFEQVRHGRLPQRGGKRLDPEVLLELPGPAGREFEIARFLHMNQRRHPNRCDVRFPLAGLRRRRRHVQAAHSDRQKLRCRCRARSTR